MSYDLTQDLGLAREMADLADSITMRRFQSASLVVESKPDLTPVSEADLRCERELRALLDSRRPEDAILGEEFGGEPSFEGRQWVIDPIDGTKNYVRGVPVWATLIALLVDGQPQLGFISAPALHRRWWATRGQGAFAQFGEDTKGIQVSKVTTLSDASVSFSSLEGWQDRGLKEQFYALSESTWRLRGFGDFWSYCMVAEGVVDIACEPEVSLWDLAALAVLVEEAGGTFSSLEGKQGPFGGSSIATNGALHEQVQQLLCPR